jgi:riboflavin biosynthesis pyrimidine reductase
VFLDGQARTLVLTKSGRKPTQRLPDGVELVSIPMSHGVLSVTAMLAELRKRGLNRLFIEGGGVTVSHFLTARVFTRLHLTVSPVFLGVGKPGVVLPPIQDMHDALRPNVRRFNFGQDVLFDFDFEAEAGPAHTRRAPELAPEENG